MTTTQGLRATGVPGLDTVLGGGLARDALVFITGAAGAGKTILGSQILFNAARTGQSTLILTAFSEGHVKLLDHLRALTFFDQELVGTTVTLLSAQALIGDQLDVAAASLVRTIRESGARLVLLDGFQGVAALFPDSHMVRRLLALLAGQLTYLDVTMIVTLEGAARDRELSLELATADVVIGLEYEVIGWRHVRRLEIVKQRGRGILGGLHPYVIDGNGISVFPRLESLPPPPGRGSIELPRDRRPFGLPELDALLGGGPSAGTTTVLTGAPGSGKTTLALHWAIEGAKPETATALLTFRERPELLREHAGIFGLDLSALMESGALKVHHTSAVEVNPDVVAATLLGMVATGSVQRLVVDDLTPLFAELGGRARDYFTALVEHLYAAGLASLFVIEIEPFVGFHFDIANTPVAAVADNVVIVQQQNVGGQLHRLLTVLKMRYTDHDRSLRELVLSEGGVKVLEPTETAPGVLDIGIQAVSELAPKPS